MGYTTTFKGELLFVNPLIEEQCEYLESIFGEDLRDHSEWNIPPDIFASYIDLVFNSDRSGIKWSGVEKTYEMTFCVNLIIELMNKKFPELPKFQLTGSFNAQGEDIDDVWTLYIDEIDNKAKERRN